MKKEHNSQAGLGLLPIAVFFGLFGYALKENPKIAEKHQDAVQEYKLNK